MPTAKPRPRPSPLLAALLLAGLLGIAGLAAAEWARFSGRPDLLLRHAGAAVPAVAAWLAALVALPRRSARLREDAAPALGLLIAGVVAAVLIPGAQGADLRTPFYPATGEAGPEISLLGWGAVILGVLLALPMASRSAAVAAGPSDAFLVLLLGASLAAPVRWALGAATGDANEGGWFATAFAFGVLLPAGAVVAAARLVGGGQNPAASRLVATAVVGAVLVVVTLLAVLVQESLAPAVVLFAGCLAVARRL